MSSDSTKYDYIIVGSGAGGGTLAARLAEAGKSVCLLEAGGDPKKLRGGDAIEPENPDRLPQDYDVPVFHAISSENKAMKWDFFVDHYSDQTRRESDPKYSADWSKVTRPPVDPDFGDAGRPDDAVGPGREGSEARGVLYPRAGTLGGCTAHNAQITVYPHNADWNYIESMTGDKSWAADNMRKYFQRLERCRYRGYSRFTHFFGINRTRHGFNGWLQTEVALPLKAFAADKPLIRTVLTAAVRALKDVGPSFWQRLKSYAKRAHALGDPNDWRNVSVDAVGLRYPPLANRNHKRIGTRERVLEVAEKHNLEIRLNSLATNVIFDQGTNGRKRAVGVRYLEGEKLYRAHWGASAQPGTPREVFTKNGGEVILAGGAFNTPQLMMLSGIGDPAQLEKHGITTQVALPGVGQNLQDRYEVGVVYKRTEDWAVLKDAKFAKGDPQYAQWEKGQGVYISNGAVLAVIKRSLEQRPLPDLFVFALLGLFRGYYPSYSALFAGYHNYLTWAILKAHTNNTAGYVQLQSADPRDTPYINFKYFDEGNDEADEDVKSVSAGVDFVREMMSPLVEQGVLAEEMSPGLSVASGKPVEDWIKARAWGHHASCTCAIGERNRGGVVNGDFEVHGVDDLRIVDASVFPRIPGFFIVSSIYTIAEKAADVILAKASS